MKKIIFVLSIFISNTVIAQSDEWNESYDFFSKIMKQENSLKLPKNLVVGFNEYVDCVVTDYIEFLNTTDCKYHYNESIISEQNHLLKQSKCLKENKNILAIDRIVQECKNKTIEKKYSF